MLQGPTIPRGACRLNGPGECRETLKAVLPTGRVRPRPGRAPPGEADRLNDISETLANDFFRFVVLNFKI